jgi:4-amino-4-deoxy-L-arabinose transferase-like glycosyltransferase
MIELITSLSDVLKKRRIQLALIMFLALGLRAGHIVSTDEWPDLYGGDYRWYAEFGSTLVRTGKTIHAPPTGPVFLLVAGYAEQLTPSGFGDGESGWLLYRMVAGDKVFPYPVGSGQTTIRLLHTLLGTATVWMIYRIGRAGWSHRVGAAAALFTAVNPLFIIEAGNLTTESLAIFLVTWALAMWLEYIPSPDWRLMTAVGILLSLAAMTRSVFLGFPVVLLTHLLVRHGWRTATRQGIILIIAFLLTFSPWTLYNLVTWDRLTLSGEGLTGMLYVGAAGWKSPQAVDQELGVTAEETDPRSRQNSYIDGFMRIISNDPAGYLLRRAKELGQALLQPHNTTFYSSESLKALSLNWLRSDRTLQGLQRLIRADHFWQKLELYFFHFGALVLGIAGLVLGIRRWRNLWPLYITIAYFLSIHTILSAIPRYLFPLEPLWTLFGMAAVVGFLSRGVVKQDAQASTSSSHSTSR